MPNKGQPRICWDSNCFLSWLQENPDRQGECGAVLQAAREGQVALYTSALTLAETVYVTKSLSSEENSRKIVAFFRNKYIRVVNVDWAIGTKARELQHQLPGLGPRDAIHLATAVQMRADALHTYDDTHLTKQSGKVPGVSLRICHPDLAYQLSLPVSQKAPNEGDADEDVTESHNA